MATCPHVSIALATYNMAPFLDQAITSVLQQTYPHFTLHVIDDGSTDQTADVVHRFRDEPRVRYTRQTNQGQASAKNCAIRQAKGEYIALLDADDTWEPEKLSKQVPILRDNPAIGIVYTNFRYMDADGRLLGSPQRRYYSGRISGRLLVDNFVNSATCLVRRECFERLGYFDESYPMAIDYDLWLRFSTEYEFHFLDEVLYNYRIWPGQMSHNHRRRFECAMDIMRKFLERYPHVVNASTVREAWAHTYTGRGRAYAYLEHDRQKAFVDYLRALRHRPLYAPALKGIAKLALGRLG
jgi:glycosyltransferase involved in cell wall biosynthesis